MFEKSLKSCFFQVQVVLNKRLTFCFNVTVRGNDTMTFVDTIRHHHPKVSWCVETLHLPPSKIHV
jgi:hypothetical protein